MEEELYAIWIGRGLWATLTQFCLLTSIEITGVAPLLALFEKWLPPRLPGRVFRHDWTVREWEVLNEDPGSGRVKRTPQFVSFYVQRRNPRYTSRCRSRAPVLDKLSHMPTTTYLEAIRQGIWEEMERDPTVFCLGEDIGIYGGAFKVTDGFIDRFGPERVIDTPIAESAIVGAAFGASLTGLRPVAEFQFMDFIGCAFNQIVNMVASAHYRWGAPAPLVIRGPSGGNVHGGPFHSQNPEPWFVHAPGLKVVCPATAYDAKGLIKAAIRDHNPVIFL
jgi:hypothetical protein